ncbi:MAG: 4Fe-4S binding protein [Syntrophales bacterium]|nr:4Fe-4S binding protein [Syntrophales bacterium]
MKITRKIIAINEEKCDGCGLCVTACAEGALQIIDGKAKLVSDTYCDGLGACLGECPQGAIDMIEREADVFDEQSVANHLHHREESLRACPGSMIRELRPAMATEEKKAGEATQPSQLKNWPVQLMLLPVNAPYLAGADVVIAADCVPCAFGDFHQRFVKNRILIIACPKLDNAAFYVDKLTEMFAKNDIRSLEVPFMEVPCCGGLVRIVQTAMQQAGKKIPVKFVKVTIDGRMLIS